MEKYAKLRKKYESRVGLIDEANADLEAQKIMVSR